MNAVVPVRENAVALIDEISVDLRSALPSTIPFDRFKATFVTAVAHNPEILSCDPQSVKTALMKAAIDNLMPDNREAAIVPFNTKVKDPQSGRENWVKLAQYMPMVQGIRKRALELGGARVHAECVYENDEFVIIAGDDPRIEHKPAPFGKPRGQIIGAYAIFKDKDGNILHREAMPKEDIEAARNVSRAKDGPGWRNFYGEFARKTVVRRGAKSIPNIPDELRTIIERDDDYVDFEQAGERAKTIEHNPLLDDRPRLPHAQSLPMEAMDPDTGEFTKVAEMATTTNTGAQPGGDALKTTAVPKGDEPRASAKPAEDSAGHQRDGQTDNGGRPAETPSSSAAAPESADGGTGDAGTAPPARVSADIFRDYHSALGRMASKESVEKAHKHFWSGKGIRLAHQDDLKLGKDIYENHLLRAEGKIDAEYLAKEVAGWIAQVTGEQL